MEQEELKWYAIHVLSGHENKIKAYLENEIKHSNLYEKIDKILVPSEEVTEMREGKKKVRTKIIFPGYIIVQMAMNNDTWYIVRNTPTVTGFVGHDKMNPPPLPEKEVNEIIYAIQEGKGKIKPKIRFDRGDNVKVTEGPFANFTGTVEEIKPEKGKVKVCLNIFGRTTPVELDFIQIEKL